MICKFCNKEMNNNNFFCGCEQKKAFEKNREPRLIRRRLKTSESNKKRYKKIKKEALNGK